MVDENERLRGLITMKDIDKVQKYPNACKDSAGRLRVGAAIGIGRDCDERAEQLIQAGVDVLVLDSAHGHSLMDNDHPLVTDGEYRIVMPSSSDKTKTVSEVRLYGRCRRRQGGHWPRSICTTHIVAGVGVPQVTAVMDGSRAAREMDRCCIADSGIKFSGDIVKAHSGGRPLRDDRLLFAGTEESPGETILYRAVPTRSTAAWAPSTP